MKILNYTTDSGREPVREFIRDLPEDTRHEVMSLLRRLELGELLTMPFSRSLSSMAHGLYELRIRDAQGQVRIFYYMKIREVIYLVHAARKKSRVISNKDRKIIHKRIIELNFHHGK